MASEQFSSGPRPKLLNPGTISLGIVPNIPSSTPYVPPTKNDWEILFQPMFDEYLNPPPCVDPQVSAVIAPEPAVSTGTPSSMTINQDAPSTSTSQTPPETPSLVIPFGVEEADHDIEVAHMDNNPAVEFSFLEPSSKESSTRVVIPNHVHSINQTPEHISKWTKDHPIDNIEGMQEELNEFERLKVWELVPRPDCIMVITLKWIYKVKLASWEYGMETCEPADTPMEEKSKLDEDPQGKAVDPTRYRGMIGTFMYLTASRPYLVFAIVHVCLVSGKAYRKALTCDANHSGCQDTQKSTSGNMQLLGDRLVICSSKKQKSTAISSTEAEYIAMS
ncbi:uncharacterized mitochondrial protein-like protein [Tanacetum coccineum]